MSFGVGLDFIYCWASFHLIYIVMITIDIVKTTLCLLPLGTEGLCLCFENVLFFLTNKFEKNQKNLYNIFVIEYLTYTAVPLNVIRFTLNVSMCFLLCMCVGVCLCVVEKVSHHFN